MKKRIVLSFIIIILTAFSACQRGQHSVAVEEEVFTQTVAGGNVDDLTSSNYTDHEVEINTTYEEEFDAEGGFRVRIIDNGKSVEITGYNGKKTELQIPSHIKDMPVTVIGNEAFAEKQLISVKIPDSVTHIGDWAFEENQLTSVNIPDSVTSIGDWAFAGNQLLKVSIPDSVTHIGDWAFAGNQLSKVNIPNSVTHIGNWAFAVNQLTSVNTPNSVVHIGKEAFAHNLLRSVIIPKSVTHIGEEAFDSDVTIIRN